MFDFEEISTLRDKLLSNDSHPKIDPKKRSGNYLHRDPSASGPRSNGPIRTARRIIFQNKFYHSIVDTNERLGLKNKFMGKTSSCRTAIGKSKINSAISDSCELI